MPDPNVLVQILPHPGNAEFEEPEMKTNISAITAPRALSLVLTLLAAVALLRGNEGFGMLALSVALVNIVLFEARGRVGKPTAEDPS